MKLKDQVASLYLCKKLKELGVKQESLFYYCDLDEKEKSARIVYTKGKIIDSDYLSAFTVGELLSSLPQRVTSSELKEPYNSFRFRFEKGIWSVGNSWDAGNREFSGFYSANYYCDTTSLEMDWYFQPLLKNICDENPANALAKMLIHFIENTLIEVSK